MWEAILRELQLNAESYDPENEDNLPDGDQNNFATAMSGIISSNNTAMFV